MLHLPDRAINQTDKLCANILTLTRPEPETLRFAESTMVTSRHLQSFDVSADGVPSRYNSEEGAHC